MNCCGLCSSLPNLYLLVGLLQCGDAAQGLALGQCPAAAPPPSPTGSEGLGCWVGCLDCFRMLLSAVTSSPTRSLCLPYTLGHRLLLKIWYCFRECGGLSQPLCSQVSPSPSGGGGEPLPPPPPGKSGLSQHTVAPSASTQTSRVGPSERPAS